MFALSKATEDAIYSTWDSIASDAYEICEGDNEIAMEMVLDANRLTMNGYPAADEELRLLYDAYGFGVVRKQLSNKMQLL